MPSNWGRPVGDDYDALVWIDQNVPVGDLILNDRSFIGLYVPSFNLKNVIFLHESGWPSKIMDRMNECGRIFDEPNNYSLIHTLISKWKIKYIFVGSENGYFDYWNMPQKFKWRPYDAPEILRCFDQNPDLKPLFRRERTGVYSVFPLYSIQYVFHLDNISNWNIFLGSSDGSIILNSKGKGTNHTINVTSKSNKDGFIGIEYRFVEPQDFSNAEFILLSFKMLNCTGIRSIKIELIDFTKNFVQYELFVPPQNTWTKYRVQYNLPAHSKESIDFSSITSVRLIIIGIKEFEYNIQVDTALKLVNMRDN